MAEPKKETVRIVLPPRKDNQPATANPRETVMLNLPPKPASIAPGVPPKPPGLVPPAPSGSGLPKPPLPPSTGSLPTPPAPSAPPAAPGSAPTPPKPPMPPVGGLKQPPSSAGIPAQSTIAPAPLKTAPKKETAKVPANTETTKPLPQATVQMAKPPAPVQSPGGASSIKIAPGSITKAPSNIPVAEEKPVFAIAALVTAIIALAVQLWMML